MNVRPLPTLLAMLAACVALAAEELPIGEVVAHSPYHAGQREMAYYLPTSYDPAVPTPILYAQSPSAGRIAASYKWLAEQMGWIVAASYGIKRGRIGEFQKDLDALLTECDRRFNVHPRLRFMTGTWIAFDLAQRRPGAVAGVFCSGRGVATGQKYPPKGVMVWLTARTDSGFRSEAVDTYLYLAPRRPAVRLELFGPKAPGSWRDRLRRGAEWMMRTYIRRGGKLLASDRKRVDDFLAAQLAMAHKLKDAGNLYAAYQIADDLFKVKGATREELTAMRGELRETLQVKAELAAWSALNKIIKRSSPAPKKGSSRVQPIVNLLDQLLDRYPDTDAARLAQSLREELRSRLPARDTPQR